MAPLPLRLCLGPKKKMQWLGGLMTASIILSSIYLFSSREYHTSYHHATRQQIQITTLNNESQRDKFDGGSSLQILNATDLQREKQRLLTELLRYQDPAAAAADAAGARVAAPTSCRPRDSVFMVKSHKCSSSTLQSILLRRAEDRGLRVALPRGGVYLSDGPRFDRRGIFLDNGTARYHIMASHMRLHEWDFDAINEVMFDDAVRITVLRDPARQFESMYTYYGWKSMFKVDLHGFLEDPDRYFKLRAAGSPRTVARNPMLYDNGLDARTLEFGNPTVSDFITAMDERFDLVLLADFFDESLILLKDIMCWTIDDIAYISQNARSKESVESISEAEHASIRQWNWGDFLLYDHFNRTLLKRIQRFGVGRMSEELDRLRERKEELSADCILKTMKAGDSRVWYPKGMKMTSFRANPNATDPHLCEQLSRPELVFLQKMREIAVVSWQSSDNGRSDDIQTARNDKNGRREGNDNGEEDIINEISSKVTHIHREDAGNHYIVGAKGGGVIERKKTGGGETRDVEKRAVSEDVVIVGHIVGRSPINSSHLSNNGTDIRRTSVRARSARSSLRGSNNVRTDTRPVAISREEAGVITDAKSDRSVNTISREESSNRAKNATRPVVMREAAGTDKSGNTTSGNSHREQESCQPRDRLLMIKTHKCSSSTLQNILLRRAEDRSLSVAMPIEGVYFHSLYKFRRRYVFRDDGHRKYDMMASHTKFDVNHFQDIKSIMKRDVKYVTILRDPATQFESMYSYYHYEKRFGANLHTFLSNPRRYFPKREHKHIFQAGRNPICHDNGLDARFLEPGDPAVDRFIASLEQIHDLVLIAEYFDVSLILLKELMCWRLDDVVYFKQNARSARTVKEISAPDVGAIRKWNWADMLLYEHFNRTFWKRVDSYGHERMARDVAELRARNEELAGDCISKTLDHSDPRVWYPPGIWVTSFKVNKNAKNLHLCNQLTRPEIGYLKKMREIAPY